MNAILRARTLRRSMVSAFVLAIAPAIAVAAVVTYAVPAGNLPAGPLHGATFNAVLPSGRLVTPQGSSVVTGMNALGVALTPDGRYAIVSNDAEHGAGAHSAVDPLTAGGFSLAVVDVASMTVVDRYRSAAGTLFAGVVAERDPANAARTLVLASGGSSNVVYVFTLDANGHLTPAPRPAIPVPAGFDPAYADEGRSFPATLALASDGRHAYVVNELADTVSAIDTVTRAVVGQPRTVGFFPIGLAVVGSHLLVTNEGMMRYSALRAPVPVPAFQNPPGDLQRASSLSLVSLGENGAFAPATSETPPVATVPMDPTPDGVRIVGGAHPSAVVATPDGAYAFVAMTNVDRIATVALGAAPHVIGGTELRLFDRGPYGTQPSALAISRDGSRLYVALAGLDAIAVIDARDPLHMHRLGLIPTGWSPMALALSADDRTLLVVNAKGFGADASGVWSTLQRIDLGDVHLIDSTRATLAATRRVLQKPPVYPKAIRDVVVIAESGGTFDAVLGDLGTGPADPTLGAEGEAATPNLHALARRYGVAGNMFAEAEGSGDGYAFLAGGGATAYSQKMAGVVGGRAPLGNAGEDPEDYPRLGSIFNALARHTIGFRDYGGGLRLAGYDAAGSADGPGLGGRFALNVPAPTILAGNVDLDYPVPSARIGADARAREFVRDFGALVAAHREPRFTYVALPDAADRRQTDQALGTIVAYLTHLPSWRSTAIVIVAGDAGGGRDHVDPSRTFAVVVSPYAKRHFVGMRHVSTASVLKTIEGIFELPALALDDLLAQDLSDFFTTTPDVSPYVAFAGRQDAIAESRRTPSLRDDQAVR